MTRPGAASVPAKYEPSITASAPAAIAFVASPEYRIPPSAMTGTSCRLATSATCATAVICGIPAPVTTRVVQIDPGPMPTLIPSAKSTTAAAASRVPTFPTTTSAPVSSVMWRALSMTLRLWAWAQSINSTSAPASSAARARSVSPGPTAAPTRSAPSGSRAASSYSRRWRIPCMVTSPTSRFSPSTTGTRSILCSYMRSNASRATTSSGTVTTSSVIAFWT